MTKGHKTTALMKRANNQSAEATHISTGKAATCFKKRQLHKNVKSMGICYICNYSVSIFNALDDLWLLVT